MKNRRKIYEILAGVGLLFCFAVMSIGCATQETPGESGDDVRVVLLPQGSNAYDVLKFEVHVFRGASGSDDFTYLKSLSLSEGTNALPLPLENIYNSEYKFLFLAYPLSGRELLLVDDSNQALVEGVTAWEDVRLYNEPRYSPAPESALLPLSVDNYYGVTTMTGPQILATKKVAGLMERVVGQMVFDFYRVEALQAGGMTPVDVISSAVGSVFDRVYSIEITYDNVTDRLKFGDDDKVVPDEYPESFVTQTVTPTFSSGLTVKFPQPGDSFGASDPNPAGSGRINGLCLLPSDGKVRVSMLFRYYDTTLSCGDPDHVHDEDTCYPVSSISLVLPKNTTITGLPVVQDSYTVNKAGIVCDRVIDVGVNGGFTMDYEWSNGVNI